jgi:hypothetical protein
LLIVVEGLRVNVGVSGFLTSVDVPREDTCELALDGCLSTRPSMLLFTMPLADRVASRDDRFRFGDADASGDNCGKEVKTLGDPVLPSELVRPFSDGVVEM